MIQQPLSLKTQLIIAGSLFVLGLASGRYLAPSHTLTEKTQTEKTNILKAHESSQVKNDITDQDIVRTVQRKTLPSGEKIVTVRTEKKSHEDKSQLRSREALQETKTEKTETTKTETLRDTSSGLELGILASVNFDSLNSARFIWGGEVIKPILGPITVGGFLFTNLTGGLVLGLRF